MAPVEEKIQNDDQEVKIRKLKKKLVQKDEKCKQFEKNEQDMISDIRKLGDENKSLNK